jgi:hypothetical protein
MGNWDVGFGAYLAFTPPTLSAFSFFFFKQVDRFHSAILPPLRSAPPHPGLCHFYGTNLLYFMRIAVSIFGL